MDVEFRDGLAHIRRGEMFVVRRGMEHRTRSAGLCQALIVEPRGVVNTGDSGGNLTAPMDEWV
jgi:mannose-6-phosphate isomerase-like protein (cupin superfamily)